MSTPNVICFETFRAARNRRRSGHADAAGAAAGQTPWNRPLGLVLNARQIAHRRAMLAQMHTHRRTDTKQ
jgi:hypothetical protein